MTAPALCPSRSPHMADDPDLFDDPPPPPPDNVIRFRPRDGQPSDPVDAGPEEVIERAPPGPCVHGRIVIDHTLRRVSCGWCGVVLDALQCLINLAAYRAQLARERQWIVTQKAELEKRRQRAIARRVFAKQKAEAVVTRANCQACGGTGWVPPGPGQSGVSRCTCRTTGERLL